MEVLVFGDSITQGFFDIEMGGWVNRLEVETQRKKIKSNHEYDITFFNLGISGDCTNRILARFDAEASARTKDGAEESTVLFSVGVNDTQRYVATGKIKTDAELFKANLTALYEKARRFTDKIIFTGILPIIEDIVQPMPWADDRSHYSKDVKEYNTMIESFCNENNCPFIPMQDLFDGRELSDVLVDGIHPNAEGHRLIFECIKDELEKANLI